MKLLILGGSGMLGHKLVSELGRSFDTLYTLRGNVPSLAPHGARPVPTDDVLDPVWLERLLDQERPDAVLNAVGIIKQVIGEGDRAHIIAVNALFPHQLQALCSARGMRLIHYSTDCVFSGAAGAQRGEAGYREEDPTDPQDIYGMTKLLGEPQGAGCLVLRTSIVGRELRGGHSLFEWFLAQRQPVRGFTRALYSGLTTLELARVTGMVLRSQPGLSGLWHVAADPIDKHALLTLLKEAYGVATPILPDDAFSCDRRLDGRRFNQITGWTPPSWAEMIAAMRDDDQAFRTLRAPPDGRPPATRALPSTVAVQ